MTIIIDDLAQEIRRVDGNNSLGSVALAEALRPYIERHVAAGVQCEYCSDYGAVGLGENSDVCPVCTPRAAIEPPKPAGAVPMPATMPYVERLCRIFRDHPHDDTSAIVLQDYAREAAARTFPREIYDWMIARDLLPEPEEGGTIDVGEIIGALDRHENELLAAGRGGAVPEGLEYVMTLVDAAAPGPWLWSENGNIVPEKYTDGCEIAAVYSERDDDGCPINASAIIAAINWLRVCGRSMLATEPLPQQPAAEGAIKSSCSNFSNNCVDSSEPAAVKQSLTTQGEGGEAVACVDCRGSGEVRGIVRHPSGDPQDDYESTIPCPSCDGAGFAQHHSRALPRPLQDLLYFTETCISAADEGVDYPASREWLNAMTTMGIMEKVGRGKWAPTDHAPAVVSRLTAPATGKESLQVEGWKSVAPPNLSDADIEAWCERHDLGHAIRGDDARAAFEDAQSAHMLPEARRLTGGQADA